MSFLNYRFNWTWEKENPKNFDWIFLTYLDQEALQRRVYLKFDITQAKQKFANIKKWF